MLNQVASRRAFLFRSGRGIAALFGATGFRCAATEATPTRLRLFCGSPPGGTPDLVARIYSRGLSGSYLPVVIVENRPGAAGQVAINALKQSPPDGGTALLLHGGAVTINPYLYSKLSYNPIDDLAAVSLAAYTDFSLAIGPAVPSRVRTLEEFIAWSRTNVSACSYGSPGMGTMPHLLGVILFREAGVDAQHVAYASGPMAIGDALGGRLAAVILPEGLLRPHHVAAKLRVLATTSEVRSRFMPDVPTFAQEKYPALTAREWLGFFMPGSTPPDALERLSRAVQEAGQSEQIVDALGELSMQGGTTSPSALNQRIAAERRHWHAVIQGMNLRLE